MRKRSMSNSVPDIVIRRLPIYLRALDLMAREGQAITSSQELGEKLGISSAQIRKDLSHFGEFGKQGTGYDVTYLRDQLERILQVDEQWPITVVGAGDLGSALANYAGFANRGFRVAAIFDNNSNKIGRQLGRLVVEDQSTMAARIAALGIQIAVIAVPASVAQEVANQLIEAGVRAILNYAPITLNVPADVYIEYIDPVIGLQSMTYYLTREQEKERA
ncbi:MAG: redox-sensing transcriptional repressor Rex [Ardenticatenaceae bacterium]|nr:redox-sensing transcriptional repressor Rex [Ardenticatenaceae bacterium]